MALSDLFTNFAEGKVTPDQAINEAYLCGANDSLHNMKPLLEKTRIEGILLGLALAKKAWGEGSYEDINENEVYYKEELAKLEFPI